MAEYTPIPWPSWRYGPNGQSEIFQSEDEVPEGWTDHPSKVGGRGNGGAGKSEGGSIDDSPYAGLTDAELFAALDKANVTYNKKWNRDKLEALLKQAEA